MRSVQLCIRWARLEQGDLPASVLIYETTSMWSYGDLILKRSSGHIAVGDYLSTTMPPKVQKLYFISRLGIC